MSLWFLYIVPIIDSQQSCYFISYTVIPITLPKVRELLELLFNPECLNSGSLFGIILYQYTPAKWKRTHCVPFILYGVHTYGCTGGIFHMGTKTCLLHNFCSMNCLCLMEGRGYFSPTFNAQNHIVPVWAQMPKIWAGNSTMQLVLPQGHPTTLCSLLSCVLLQL